MNETYVTKFLGLDLDKKLNFVDKSIGLLYKLKRFLPETILKALITPRLFIHTYHMA